MQSILERQLGVTPGGNLASARPSRLLSVAAVVIVLTVAVYITFFLLPSFSEPEELDIPKIPERPKKATSGGKVSNKQQLAASKKQISKSNKKSKLDDAAALEEIDAIGATVPDEPQQDNENNKNNGNAVPPTTAVSEDAAAQKRRKQEESRRRRIESSHEDSHGDEQHLPHHHDPHGTHLKIEAWGYNKNRNIPRWNAIKESIEADLEHQSGHNNNNNNNHNKPFVLVDYGSDQGFFSISAASTFQSRGIFVVSVELGGVGGEIWKKKAQEGNDVLSVQQKMAHRYHVEDSMMICQTRISPQMFFDLAARNETHRYQFVLSIFHWFDLPTRKDFEAAIVALFRNAQSTFIELPTIGDRSALIRKQVGWTNFEKWYDGRSDIKDVIQDAADAHHFPVKVTKIVSVPWLRWTRDMYRVDWDLSRMAENGGQQHHQPSLHFTCPKRREVYHCAKREQLNKCKTIR